MQGEPGAVSPLGPSKVTCIPLAQGTTTDFRSPALLCYLFFQRTFQGPLFIASPPQESQAA